LFILFDLHFFHVGLCKKNILPIANSKEEQIEFFIEDVLRELHSVNLGASLKENENYSKW
jgi:hypothetical protein